MKRIITSAVFALLLVTAGCKEKSAENQTANQAETETQTENQNENTETVSKEPAPKLERAYGQIDARPFGTKENPYKEDELIPLRGLVYGQDDFPDFATPLPIGDKIFITDVMEVYRTSDRDPYDPPFAFPAGSTAYYIGAGNSGDIRVVDENGNTGWIDDEDVTRKDYIRQKNYTFSDSMIKKEWEKSGYDVAKFSPDGKLIALMRWNYNRSSEDAILICERDSGKRKFTINAKLDQTNPICGAFSPDSRYFYYITEDKYLNQADLKDETVNHFGSPTPAEIESKGRWEHLRSVHPLPDGENILCGVYYEPWAMYNIKTGKWTYKKNEKFMWANSFAFSPDGKFIAGSATNPSDLSVWEADTKKLLWQRVWEFSGDLYYSKDGKYLYVVNGTGITKLDANTGETISKIDINFPTCLYLQHFSALPQKDRVVYSLNSNPSGSQGGFSYLYFYELSTGNLVQVEHIEEGEKRTQIRGIELSPDGNMISLCIADGSRVTECHQAVCSVNLDKKAKSIPKIKRDKTEEKYTKFLTSTTFDAGWWTLSFYEDGIYSLSARHDGSFYGNWMIDSQPDKSSYWIYTTELKYKSSNASMYPDEDRLYNKRWMVDPDYEDFDFKGLISDNTRTFYSNTQSPSGKTYDLDGERVIKRSGENKYIYINENTKMRRKPSLSAETVSLPYYYYNGDYSGHVKERVVVFAGEYFQVHGETEKKDTIDGVTSPWYLIYEDDNLGGEDTRFERVWVFGGFSTEFDGSEIESYREKGKSDLRESIMGKGILNYNSDDYYHEERRSWD